MPGVTETSAGRTVAAVRELILRGDFPAGARLGEVELAERLGVSRTPVREALGRLAAEGLVEIVPNRGARVTSWTVAELEGVFDLRAALEPRLTALAVPQAAPPTSPRSTSWPRPCSTSAPPGPTRTSTRSCRSTARSTGGSSRSPTSPRWRARWPARSTPPIVLRNFHTYDEASLRRSLAHHLEIVAAVRAGDPAWAQAVMTAHIRNARAVMVRAAAGQQAPGGNVTYRLGVDVGGTFTDVLLVEEGSGATWRAKTASTPSDQAVGVRNGIAQVCDEAGIALSDVAQVLHGTTVATNAILEGKGATVGLVTTKGFRQVLQIARSYVPGGLAGWIIWPKPEPLAALENTVEVDERIASDGTVIRELDDADVRAQLAKLDGIDALAVSLINSFADPAHERRIAAIAAEVLPGVPVSLSSDVLPEMREYERTVTTVANGYVQPQVKRYVETLAAGLREGGVAGELAILRSDGGLSAAEAAVAAPVTMLLSGPAGGVTGAVWIAEQCGFADLITFDMGGTSTDVALVQGLTPADRARDEGRRPHRARVQRGRPHGRRGRRLDRARARADEGAARRPAVGGRRPRSRRVRQGRRRADRHRRQRRARLPPAVARGRRDRARRRRRAGGGADRRRRHGPGVGRGRGGGHRRHRQREHARRPAPGVGAAGLRPAGLRPRRVRRRGPVARQRAWAG